MAAARLFGCFGSPANPEGRGCKYFGELIDAAPNSFLLQRKESPVLVLSRHRDEVVRIGDDISVMVVDIRGDKVRLGIEAPADVPIHREEIYDAILRERNSARLDETQITPLPASHDAAVIKMAQNILATTVEHSGTHAMRAVCAELLRVKGKAA